MSWNSAASLVTYHSWLLTKPWKVMFVLSRGEVTLFLGGQAAHVLHLSGLSTRAERYAQTTIRYDTWYGAHDTICSTMHLPFLAGKQRLVIPACDPKHRTPPITTAFAVMMRNGYNNGGLLKVSRCSVFVMNLLVLLEYTGCYLRYLMFVSNFGKCYNCIVSYLPQSVLRYVP